MLRTDHGRIRGQIENPQAIFLFSVIHDPVRDFVLGPTWWHQWSIRRGYSFLREGFVHEAVQLDTIKSMPQLRTTTIPHGTYAFPLPKQSRLNVRADLAIPEDATVLLSFGHIRDGKNLDLVIRVIADHPHVYLIVAGQEQSSTQKPIRYYQRLARAANVESRCRWIHKHIHEGEIGNLFNAADVVLLAYSANFRSASGVLNAAVYYRKPCIASSGAGNLLTVVQRYQLGIFVEPDSAAAIARGLHEFAAQPPSPRWDEYERDHTWQKNAELVKQRMFDSA